MPTKFSRSLKRNLETLSDLLMLDTSDDITLREFTALGLDCALFFVQGMCSGQQIADNVLRPMMLSREEASGAEAMELATKKLIQVAEITTEKNIAMAVEQLMQGQALLLLDTVDQAIIMDLRQYVRRGITTPQTESVVVGPQEAFNEVMRDNLTLLHRRLQSPMFVTEILKVGTQISTQVALCYIDGTCKQETVEEIKRRIGGLAVDYVLTSGSLEQLIEDDPYAPLPQVAATERPDRAVSFLLEGQAVLLLDGSPRAIAMPMGFWHLFHAPDDSYMRWYYGMFTRFIRMFGALVSLLLPAVFVALVVFHPTSIPMTLLTSIMESRSVVPLSLFGEALLMITIFNLINEAGVRVPGIMGSSLGLVSALILGTAAVQAGLVSPLLIIVVALSGLGSYALPNYSLSFAYRLEQMLLLIAGGIMGLTGVCLMGVLVICQIAGMESLNQPYLAPSSPRRAHNPDLFLRTPLFRQRLRGYLSNPSNMNRATGRMRRFGEGGRKKQ